MKGEAVLKIGLLVFVVGAIFGDSQKRHAGVFDRVDFNLCTCPFGLHSAQRASTCNAVEARRCAGSQIAVLSWTILGRMARRTAGVV